MNQCKKKKHGRSTGDQNGSNLIKNRVDAKGGGEGVQGKPNAVDY